MPANRMSLHEDQSPAIRSVVIVFTVIGTLILAFAMPAMVIGAFAGPHLLIPAATMFVVGGAVNAVGRGISRGTRPACVIGAILATMVSAAWTWWAVALLLQSQESLSVRFFLGLMALALGAPFLAAALTLMKNWPANHMNRHE